MKSSAKPRWLKASAVVLGVLILAGGCLLLRPGTSTVTLKETLPAAQHATGEPRQRSQSAETGISEGAAAPTNASTHYAERLSLALALPDRSDREREFGGLFHRWCLDNPEQALAWLLAHPLDESLRDPALLFALERITLTDLDHGLQLCSTLLQTPLQKNFYHGLFHRLALESPQRALALLDRLQDSEGRHRALQSIMNVWADSNPDAARNWLTTLPAGEERSVAAEALLRRLLHTNAEDALDLLGEIPAGASRDKLVAESLQALATHDANAALPLLALLPPGPERTQSLVTLAQSLSTHSPAEALAWEARLASTEERSLVLRNILQTWSGTDLSAAENYVRTQLVNAEQTQGAAIIAGNLAAEDPQKALAWVRSLGNPEALAPAFDAIANRWARTDAAACCQWLETLAAGADNTRLLCGALTYWADNDSRAAQGFVNALSPERQASAATTLAPLLAQSDPLGTLSWARALSDSQAAQQAVEAAYLRWLDNDAAAASAWVRKDDTLPQALRQRLLSLKAP